MANKKRSYVPPMAVMVNESTLEPRYINAHGINFKIDLSMVHDGDVLLLLSDVRKAIAQTPTEDVVKVVRCKDCTYRNKDNIGRFSCDLTDTYVVEQDYCSRGKRKELI